MYVWTYIAYHQENSSFIYGGAFSWRITPLIEVNSRGIRSQQYEVTYENQTKITDITMLLAIEDTNSIFFEENERKLQQYENDCRYLLSTTQTCWTHRKNINRKIIPQN